MIIFIDIFMIITITTPIGGSQSDLKFIGGPELIHDRPDSPTRLQPVGRVVVQQPPDEEGLLHVGVAVPVGGQLYLL